MKGRETMDNQMKKESFQKGLKSAKNVGGGIALAVIALILIFGSTYQIKEQEQAVLVTFGKAKAVTESGLHFKIPFIQQVKKVDTTIQGFTIGYNPETNETIETEAVMITSDYNFIDVDFFVEYKIADPVKALYASQQPQMILKNLAQSCIRTVIGTYEVDSVLTAGKNEIQAAIKEMILAKLETQDIGLQLVNITIQDSQPPTAEIIQAFKAVETAKQGKETALNNANKYRNEKLPGAQAEADKIVKNAEAYKQERINEATGQVSRFNAMYEEYIKNPTVTKQRMFYEAMEDILPELDIVIDSSNGVQKLLPLEPFVTTQETINESTDTSTTDENNQ
jgi:modulator of FtsH protease HflK